MLEIGLINMYIYLDTADGDIKSMRTAQRSCIKWLTKVDEAKEVRTDRSV